MQAVDSWGAAQIRASRVVHRAPETLHDAPVFAADPLNLFLLAGIEDRQVTILDGDQIEPLRQLSLRSRPQLEPQLTPDGRYAYFASRDGWIARLDLWNLALVAEVRAGIETREIAISSDGRYVAVANDAPHTLVVLDVDLNPIAMLEGRDLAGRRSSRVATIRDAARRHSFVAALPGISELWEVSYDPAAPEVAEGLVHDYRLREGAFVSGFLRARRTPLDRPVDEIAVLPDGRQVAAIQESRGPLQIIHLDVRRRIATLDLPGMPRLRDAANWQRAGRNVLAVANQGAGVLTTIDVSSWKTLVQVALPGPGMHLGSHPAGARVLLDVALGAEYRDTLQVVDKQTLAVVAQLRPVPGGVPGDVAFDRRGRVFLAGVVAPGHPLIAYDASTLTEVKRLSIGKAVRKYNVFNHISR